jgi:2-C-methyl-D-erythritol 4-phosphate cytidylyltransferase/2-C-methyl-D-erythritol 4-phosphate cytidylyltransferase/2-C-methyl-D-erythritol 2,4-cyclodiphosphate synthase
VFPAAAVICAAGSSSRMNGGRPGGVKKEYCRIGENAVDGGGKSLSVLGAAVTAFAACARVGPIVVVIAPGEEGKAAAVLPEGFLEQKPGRVFFVSGGQTRRQSVLNALVFLKSVNPEYVLIHDGARPWVSPSLINRVLDAVMEHRAAIPLIPVVETPKEVDRLPGPGETGFITRHLRRAETGAAQTPQGFGFAGILAAHEKAALSGREYTDDAEIWGEFAGRVAVIAGEGANKKITYPEDLYAVCGVGESLDV